MNCSSISKLKWLRESMLRVVVACMFSLWEALEDGLEVCITTMRTRLTGFFWHCFDADATLSVIGEIKFIQYIVKLGDQSFSFSYLSRFFLYVLTIEEKRLIRTTAYNYPSNNQNLIKQSYYSFYGFPHALNVVFGFDRSFP